MTTSASGSSAAAAPDWRRNQAAVTIATFVGFTAFTLAMPFLPLYFEQLGVHDTGALAIWSGVSLGVTPAITAAVAPIWARIAERHGRKLMVERSLIAFVVVMAALGAVRAPWQVLALRALLGLFAGYGPIALTMAAESAPHEHMATAIGWVQTAQRLGPTLGPVVGGALAAALGLRQTFVVAAGLYLGALILVFVGYREEGLRAPEHHDEGAGPPTWSTLRAMPHFFLFLGVIFGLQLVDRSFGPVLPLYLGQMGTPPERIAFVSGAVFTITAGAAALGHHVTSRLLQRWRPALVVAPACAVGAVGAAAFGLGLPTEVLMLTAVLFGIGIGIATTAVYTAAGRAASVSARGVVFGYLTTGYLVALAVSPVVAGLVGARSMRAVFFLDAAGLAVMAGVVRRGMA
ncbi:MAG TPA: MFS transporter [Vicinamibacterales bacterium]|nr:MFS transporter [Vicinamibacterales bacterium]